MLASVFLGYPPTINFWRWTRKCESFMYKFCVLEGLPGTASLLTMSALQSGCQVSCSVDEGADSEARWVVQGHTAGDC